MEVCLQLSCGVVRQIASPKKSFTSRFGLAWFTVTKMSFVSDTVTLSLAPSQDLPVSQDFY